MIPQAAIVVAALGLAAVGLGLELHRGRLVDSWFGSGRRGPPWWRLLLDHARVPGRQRRRHERAEAQLPLLVEHLVLGGQAGLGLLESLSLARESLPEPLQSEVGAVLDLVSVGHSLRAALHDRTSSARGWLRRLLEQLLAGEELGVPLEEILVGEAAVLVEIQLHRQEARANSLSLAISLVALVFLFPPLVLLVLIPNLMMFLANW